MALNPGQGLLITNGSKTASIDISTATTIEDLFNLIKAENLDLDVAINDAGNGLAISSRLSGANLSIGANDDSSAADLGIRTLDETTLLAELNLGRGVPVKNLDENGNLLPALLEITRRDGSTTNIDLKGLDTIQEVIDAISAVDGNLTASLNSVGNGISIVDTSGTGPLTVVESQISTALGLDGQEPGNVNTVPLAGRDVNPDRADGVFSILAGIELALRTGDDNELARLDKVISGEIKRFNLVRADIGARLQVLDRMENRLLDEEVHLQAALSTELDVDMTLAVTQFSATSAALQATLQVAASSLQLSLFNFL